MKQEELPQQLEFHISCHMWHRHEKAYRLLTFHYNPEIKQQLLELRPTPNIPI